MDNSFITKDQNTRSGVRKVSSTGEKKKKQDGETGLLHEKKPSHAIHKISSNLSKTLLLNLLNIKYIEKKKEMTLQDLTSKFSWYDLSSKKIKIK